MPKKYINDRIQLLIDSIKYEEAEYKQAKELGAPNCYGAAYSLGALDRLRQELSSHEDYLKNLGQGK